MASIGTFPFGQPVQEIVQTDCTPKNVFILGVYSSAVHARWINSGGKTVINALAVANEPYIFWRGENAEYIIEKIVVPDELGKLIPPQQEFNGPSGIALDNLILNPLGLDRKKVWLCDLVPHSCMNPSQSKALDRAYLSISPKYGLPTPSVPPLPKPIADEARRNEILNEIMASEARILILLGDLPIRWFLAYFDNRWSKLSDFGDDYPSYGRLHDTHLGSKEIKVLPIAHPRQIAKLGQSSVFWHDAHADWIKQSANIVSQSIKSP
jgi:uracil-DNA glycosylase